MPLAGEHHAGRAGHRLPAECRARSLARGGRHLGLITLALTWLAVIPARTAKLIDGLVASSCPLALRPFMSSTFVPTATMPTPVRVFDENQPVTAIAEMLRSLLTSRLAGTAIWTAVAWWVGIAITAYAFAARAYERMSQSPAPIRLP